MNALGFGPIRFIAGENGGKYPHCHSVFIESAGVLIDPASDRRQLARLKAERAVSEVWLTHWHEDHITHLDLFEHLPLKMAAEDAPPLSDVGLFLDAYGIVKPEHRRYWTDIMHRHFHYKPRRPADFLEDGQIVELGDVSVEVIRTPGHTPGHTAFFFREPAVLFMGDYDLTRFGPWYGDRDSSIADTIASIDRLRSVPAKTWLTCHEDGVFAREPGTLWDDYLAVIDRRESQLLDLLRIPRSMEEIVNAWIVYRKPREPEAFFAFAEEALMRKHLDRLTASGAVAVEGEKYVRRF